MTIDVARSVKKMFVDGKWVESAGRAQGAPLGANR